MATARWIRALRGRVVEFTRWISPATCARTSTKASSCAAHGETLSGESRARAGARPALKSAEGAPCGNGGSAADCSISPRSSWALRARAPGLPAVSLTTDTSALTAIANDYDYDRVFSKQVEALGNEGDVLLAISTSGNSKNVVEAMKAAQARKLVVIALTGRDGGTMGRMCGPRDFHINVAHQRTMRVQEVHLLVVHCLCEVVDNVIFGERNEPQVDLDRRRRNRRRAVAGLWRADGDGCGGHRRDGLGPAHHRHLRRGRKHRVEGDRPPAATSFPERM
jgi:phosphoheptose isomerase